mmetsp:Transcript_14095/g.41451  ORF Transcript_14095/g.41451 Transcript_14095/m.41451 type:complete len:323 (-) Transcript_14095:386-1354(-)
MDRLVARASPDVLCVSRRCCRSLARASALSAVALASSKDAVAAISSAPVLFTAPRSAISLCSRAFALSLAPFRAVVRFLTTRSRAVLLDRRDRHVALSLRISSSRSLGTWICPLRGAGSQRASQVGNVADVLLRPSRMRAWSRSYCAWRSLSRVACVRVCLCREDTSFERSAEFLRSASIACSVVCLTFTASARSFSNRLVRLSSLARASSACRRRRVWLDRSSAVRCSCSSRDSTKVCMFWVSFRTNSRSDSRRNFSVVAWSRLEAASSASLVRRSTSCRCWRSSASKDSTASREDHCCCGWGDWPYWCPYCMEEDWCCAC